MFSKLYPQLFLTTSKTHSTVTLLAKFLGRSILHSLKIANSYANNCKDIDAKIGKILGWLDLGTSII